MHITPINSTAQKNKQNFGGKIYSKQTLDNYIGLLGEYKKAGKTLERKMQVITEATKIKLEETNNQIKPLISSDENFLWAITPAKTKDQFARFVVKNTSIYASSAPYNSWTTVIDMIRKRIINERPDTLLKEFKDVEPSIKEPIHTDKLKKLKGLLKKKQNHINDLEDRKEDFAMNHYETISIIERNMNRIEPKRSSQQIETFFRELYHRALEKQPELKSVYKKGYNKYYTTHKNDQLKLGQLKQQASTYGHLMVEDHLKYGSMEQDNVPF